MGANNITQGPVSNEDSIEQEIQHPTISGELHIRVYDNGALEIHVPETSNELTSEEIENLTFIVNRRLQEQRIAKMSMELFKSRLG